MTIVFAGGGTGGHFYPIIAIAEAIRAIARERTLVSPRLYFVAPAPFDEEALFENEITFVPCPAGKLRRYRSFMNVTDTLKTAWGTLRALVTLFRLYPDVVVSKGGYASVPVTLAAWILRIPVIIHESDARPGRANLLAAKFAERIAVTFGESARYFPAAARGKIARTGIPIRKALFSLDAPGAAESLRLDKSVPTVLVLGGSLGSVRINDAVLTALPDLLSFANVIHQTGNANSKDVTARSSVILSGNANRERYHPFPYLSTLSLRQAAAAAAVIVSRAGSTAIAEIAAWKKPSILIPIPEEVSHDQRANAYAYAGSGAAAVIEEANLTPHLLASEVKRIVSDKSLAKTMGETGAVFADADAARIIAEEAIRMALAHEGR